MKSQRVKIQQKHVVYISSLDSNAKQTLHAVRSHWQAESMYWVLDMTFREDEYRIRKNEGHSLLM